MARAAEEKALAPSTGRKWPWLKKAAQNANLVLARAVLFFFFFLLSVIVLLCS